MDLLNAPAAVDPAELLRRFLVPVPTPPPRRRDEEVLEGAERFTLAVDRWRLTAYAWGAGPPVLLAHGWGSRVAHLAAFVEPLVAAGCRVLAVEMPGHGPAPAVESSLVQFELALSALGEVAGPARGVLAHSGGALATTMALHHGLRAERVALLAPMVRLERSAERFAAAFGGVDDDGLAAFKQAMLSHFSPALWDSIAADLLAGDLDVPVLIVHDRDDPEVPYDEAVLLAEAWPGARLVTASRVGHRLLLRQRDVVAMAAGFVTAG
jgi:pimeloyl-ACP methyl ester carboxylesterase